MRIHHLNCATIRPLGGRLLNGNGGWVTGARIVCHCLLVEAADGLVLVDTGLGLEDVAAPGRRLGWGFTAMSRARLDPEETAARQVERLGHSRTDVRHVVMTHLDVDHAGGLPDFPHARVHVTANEWEAATSRRTILDRARYRPEHWAHGPDWALHRPGDSAWFGLTDAGAIDGYSAEIRMVALPGHTLGHAGVAVRTETDWLLHAGDAFFDQRELDVERPRCPRIHDWFQRAVHADATAWAESRTRLRTLSRDHGEEIRMFCSHDVAEFERLATKTEPKAT